MNEYITTHMNQPWFYCKIVKQNFKKLLFRNRNSEKNIGCGLAPDSVRNYLYQLYGGSYSLRVADLGNIIAGHSSDDTYFALQTVVDNLIRNNIVPIIIGVIKT